ncbi:MAG: hypothetical protein VCA35_08920 [Roseibacillus sp.]
MVERYHESLADRRDLAIIHVNLDQTEKAATQWGVKTKIPWLTLLKEEKKAFEAEFVELFSIRGIPAYILVSAEGEVIAQGKQEVLAALDQNAG